jgi:hypothetical protein
MKITDIEPHQLGCCEDLGQMFIVGHLCADVKCKQSESHFDEQK